MKSARETAADVLVSVDRDGAYSSVKLTETLGKCHFDDERDKKLVSSLVFTVTENRLAIDGVLTRYLTKPLAKLPPFVLALLRLGAAQILYFDKIPVSAAVNESVKIAKKRGFAYASGMINAVLRKVAASKKDGENSEKTVSLAEKYSFPENLANIFISKFGEETTARIFDAFEGRRPVFVRVNTLKTDAEGLADALEADGVTVKKTELENCLEIENFGDITSLAAFKIGLFHVQDMSSQLCALTLGAREGDTVIDCCAAPGGKTFTVPVEPGEEISEDDLPDLSAAAQNCSQGFCGNRNVES